MISEDFDDDSDLPEPDAGPTGEVLRVPVPDDKNGERLDRFLGEAVRDLSRTRLQALIAAGAVDGGDGAIMNPRHKVRGGDLYTVSVPASRDGTPQAQDIPIRVLFEDEHLIAIDKPAGMVVHPAPGHPDGTLVNALLHHCGPGFANVGGAARPGIVHRLDIGTSGVMIAAKTEQAYLALTNTFAAHDLERTYEALVWGCPSPRRGEIVGNIGRSPTNRKKMAVLRRGGKPAKTHYEVIESYQDSISLVRCRLETGRTHQIRVHLTHIGFSIVGDPTYGNNRTKTKAGNVHGLLSAEIDRPLLHAVSLIINHPVTGETMRFGSEKDIIFNKLIDSLKSS